MTCIGGRGAFVLLLDEQDGVVGHESDVLDAIRDVMYGTRPKRFAIRQQVLSLHAEPVIRDRRRQTC